MTDFILPIFPLVSEYVTEYLALHILLHSLGEGHWVGQIA